MGAPSKRAKKKRSAAEFDIAKLAAMLATPRGNGIPVTSWTLEEIFAARDAQLRGDFRLPAKMAEAMRTDDALAPALENRLAPQRSIRVEMVAAKKSPKAKAKQISDEADALFGQDGVGVTPDTLASIHAYLVNHEVAFGCNVATPREDGSRVDFEMHAWPIENVRWDPMRRSFVTRVESSVYTDGQSEVLITHGDGRWVIFQRYEVDPFKHGAILAAAPVWARHAYGIRDWAKSSVAHGNVKMLGEMPEGSALQESDGSGNTVDTPEALALVTLLRNMVDGDSPIGLLPAGSKATFVNNNSTAWQVFSELVGNGESAAARIYLGTDAVMGAKGGAPGVDVQALFGVAATKVESDLKCIARGVNTGVIEPWCATNFGDTSYAPARRYMMPDADADAERASRDTRRKAFHADIKSAKENGFVVDQGYVNDVAKQYGVTPPLLPPAPALKEATPPQEAAPPAGAPAPPPAPAAASAAPEPTASEKAEQASKLSAALLADIREARQLGLQFTQEQINETAARYGVPAPKALP